MYQIEDIKNKILCGDALVELKKFPNETIDMVCCSPPYYGLRNYGVDGQLGLEKTFEEYLAKMLLITAEIKRVLKKTGSFWLNMGDCYGGLPAGNKSISEANIGNDSLYVRKMKQCEGAKSSIRFDKKNYGGLSENQNTMKQGRSGNDKCMLMQPERLAIKMIDEQSWILRNKIKWAKQVLLFKEKKTKGSVMPTSVKDRFNESGEELYFFVKNKKYYSDLDAVRLPPQSELNFERPRMGQGNQTIYEQKRAAGIIRQKDYPESKYNKFNYRVRDAKRKAGQPQFKASEEEIKRYNEIPEDYGKKKLQNLPDKGKTLNRWMSGTPNFVKQLEARMSDTKNKDQKSSRTYNLKKLLSEVRLGIKPNTGMEPNKVNDPRGNHEGGPGSWRDFKDNPENSFPKHLERNAHLGMKSAPQPNEPNAFYPLGKGLPTIWLIGSEPHNFSKELELEGIDHFAIFPQALLEIPIKFGCPEKGIVLDPFMGSGTTAVVARKLGRNYLGIELSPAYCKIAAKRLAQQTLL